MALTKVLLVLVIVSFVSAAQFSSTEATELTSRHNAKRNAVNPTASPAIPALTWNTTLANFASNYAESLKASCNLVHSTSPYGENLAWRIPAGTVLAAGQWAIDAWDNEKVDYNLAANTCNPGKVCGHYTQVVWANSRRVGCGYAICASGAIIVSCNYDPPGNWNGQRPYTAGSGSGSGSCTPTCPANACGSVSSCGTTISCVCPSGSFCNAGTCATCPSPCTAGSCGTRTHPSCPSISVNCGNCAAGFSCVNNLCQATTPACTTSICTANNRTCGSFSSSSCTGSVSCGTCPSTQTCSASTGRCVAAPCNGACSSPSQTCNTATNACVCASGYTLINNVCTIQSNGNPVWTSDFTVASGPSALAVVTNTLTISGSSSTPTIVRFSRPNAVINISWTKITAEVRQTTGSFGFGFRVGSLSASDDGVYIYNNNIGLSNYNVGYNIKKNGAWLATTPSTQAFAQNRWSVNVPIQVSSWLTTNQTNGLTYVYLGTAYTETIASTTYSYTATAGFGFSTAGNFGTSAGGVAIYSRRTSTATTTVTKFTVATATTLSVSLYSCINDTAWAAMFRNLTGCPTCTVSVRAVGENGRCKAAGAKEAASALVVVIESSTIASEAVATNFIAAVESGSAAVAPLAVQSVAIVPGIEGAVLAGLPEVVPLVAGAGAGGGAAGGLSGGAIAGIVVGSVAGAVLIVGVTTVVVAAVIVAAVIVAKKASDSDDSSSGPSRADPEVNKRGSIRDTIYNMFRAPRGGVDVMNNPSGHQSITARAPKA